MYKNLILLMSLIFIGTSDLIAGTYEDYQAQTQKIYEGYEDSNKNAWKTHEDEVRKIWEEYTYPTRKIFVSYSKKKTSRLTVNFVKGYVEIENKGNKKKSEEEMWKLVKKYSHLYQDLVDVKGAKTLREAFFKSLLNSKDEHNSKRINFVKNHVKKRALKYLGVARVWAKKYRIPLGLILAVMWQESAFNPLARSHIPAFGLMQIVPKYAGIEVARYLKKNIKVDGNFLYDPRNNIRWGSTYLKMLDEKFAFIKDAKKRIPFIIASYNWGPHRLKKNYKRGRIKLGTPEEIKNQIVKIAPKETKDYLVKVLDKWSKLEAQKWI
jgi:membrane-bound lytic murein transglycosylase C